ncbi:MAG: hypothetical protein KC503_04795 [Myxococcales bacterium]|nr:hypothetical protein [Myxococcales bacterium]
MAEPAEKNADASATDASATDASEQQRIAQLEAEVTRLREKLGDSGPEPADEAVEAQIVRKASPHRIAAIVVAVVVVSLSVMIAIFTALSSGFDSVAGKAAGIFVPGKGSAGERAPAPRRRAPAPKEETPRAPGL